MEGVVITELSLSEIESSIGVTSLIPVIPRTFPFLMGEIVVTQNIYGLSNYDVIATMDSNGRITYTLPTIANTTESIGQVLVIYTGVSIGSQIISAEVSNVASGWSIVSTISFTDTVRVNITNLQLKLSFYYQFEYTWGLNPPSYYPSIDLYIYLPASSLATPPPLISSTTYPLITITALALTSDLTRISQLTFNVLTDRSICGRGETGVTSNTYTFYNINLYPIIIGLGEALMEKIGALIHQNIIIDYVTLVKYSVVRLILSFLLCICPFNREFNIKYLEQRYYKSFLRELSKSQFREALEIFTNPIYGFLGYQKAFIC